MNPLNRLNPVPWSICNGSDARTPDAYDKCLRQFNFDSAERYEPESHTTFCNIAVSDSAPSLGIHVPHVHLQYTAAYLVREFSANDLFDWFPSDEGQAFGWQPVTADVAKESAAKGFPTVFVYQAPNSDGHIGWLGPDGNASQAGATCGYGIPLTKVFSPGMMPSVRFYTHF